MHTSESKAVDPAGGSNDHISLVNLKSLLIPSIGELDATTKAKSFHEHWTYVLTLYTRSQLTKESDRLAASSGIIDMFASLYDFEQSDCRAGIWKPYLAYQLIWGGESNRHDHEIMEGAPSWSWASCGRSVIYRQKLYLSIPLVSVAEDGRVTEASQNAGQSSIWLQGFPCTVGYLAELLVSPKYEMGEGRWTAGQRLKSVVGSCDWNDLSSAKKAWSWMESLVFRPTWRQVDDVELLDEYNREVAGLMLKPTGERRGQYERVGAFTTISGDIELPETYSPQKLDGQFFQALDEEQGYIIEIV
jgi:hypothetical protein